MLGIGNSRNNRNMRTLNGLAMFKALLWGMTFLFLPIMLAGSGLSGLEIGLLFSALTATTIIITFPIGVLNDKLGTKGMIMAGLLLLALYFFGLAGAQGFWILLPVFILGGAAATIFDSSAIGMVFKKLKIFSRGRSLGVYYLALELGGGAGLIIGGFLLFSGNFSIVLLATSVLFLLAFFVSRKLPNTGKSSFPLMKYKNLLFRKNVLLLLIPLVLYSSHWGVEQTCYSLFLKTELGLDTITSGIYMGIPILLLGVFAFYSGVAIDRKKKDGKIFLSGLLFSGIGHMLMILQPVFISFLFRIIHELGDAMITVSYNVIFSKVFPKKTIAGNSSLMGLVMSGGSILGALVFSPIGQLYGYGIPFIVSGIIGISSAGALFVLKSRIKM